MKISLSFLFMSMKIGSFASRHMGPRIEDQNSMLTTIGCSSIDELIDKTVPPAIRLRETLDLPDALTESEYLEHLDELASKNVVYRNYIGMGYYPTEVPSVIREEIFWKTPAGTQLTLHIRQRFLRVDLKLF